MLAHSRNVWYTYISERDTEALRETKGNHEMATTRKQTEITQASVARGVDKATHEVFYVVKSDTQANVWYEVRWNEQALCWQDKCPAHSADCKHVRAVQEVLRVRRATIAVAMSGPVERPTSQKGNLNGGGREFSLLR